MFAAQLQRTKPHGKNMSEHHKHKPGECNSRHNNNMFALVLETPSPKSRIVAIATRGRITYACHSFINTFVVS